MSKEYTVQTQYRTHALSSHSRRGAVSIVHGQKVYDNVQHPIAYSKRIFASDPNANVFVRFSEDHQYRITNDGEIIFPWS